MRRLNKTFSAEQAPAIRLRDLLLRKIMSNVLGYDHNQYIKDEILTPLGLTNTFSSVHEINLVDLMSGYYVGYENDFKALDQGYVATAQDIGDFLIALNKGAFKYLWPKETMLIWP